MTGIHHSDHDSRRMILRLAMTAALEQLRANIDQPIVAVAVASQTMILALDAEERHDHEQMEHEDGSVVFELPQYTDAATRRLALRSAILDSSQHLWNAGRSTAARIAVVCAIEILERALAVEDCLESAR